MIEYKKKMNTSSEIKASFHPIIKEWFETYFEDFTPPQKYSIMNVTNKKNTLICSPTGSGKTLSAFLGILNHLMFLSDSDQLENKIYAVYISPLKALGNDIEKNLKEPVRQINEIAKKYGKEFKPKIAIRTGDTSSYQKQLMTKHAPHILIITPESLSISLSTKKFIEKFSNVDWLIIDEIHSLAESKRGCLLMNEVEYLDKINNYELTRIGLSATVSPIKEMAKFLVGLQYKTKDFKPCQIINVDFIKKLDLKVLSPVKNILDAKYFELEKSSYQLIHKLVQEHKTVLIFTNTRAGTERVVHKLKLAFPKFYNDNNVRAHHGSLSKEVRKSVEDDLKLGNVKVVVCSTSLELGIDIGFIDLVILLGSPKSVARALQRIGRSGHKLHETSKGRIIVQNQDDLVECSVLLKNAIEKKIDRIHIPTNCFDVLSQNIVGYLLRTDSNLYDLHDFYKSTYCYSNLGFGDFMKVIEYLSGLNTDLKFRNVYPKITFDENTNVLSKKGGKTRIIYMTNLGTITQTTGIIVKQGINRIGTIEETFLERLKPGDVFVLGGMSYEFRHAKGTVAQVIEVPSKKPTVPRWFSQNLPLSFDLAVSILNLKSIVSDLIKKKKKKEVIDYIFDNYYLDYNAAYSIYTYIYEQSKISSNATREKIVIEYFKEFDKRYVFFHTLYGRRVNDVLSRVIGYVIAKKENQDFEIGINDNGFYLMSHKKINIKPYLALLDSQNIDQIALNSIKNSQVYKRRFRQVATRALMILTNYDGKQKYVGRQQVTSMILIKSLREFDENFVILKETEREILYDLMDLANAKQIIKEINTGRIKVELKNLEIPSPCSFNLLLQSYADILKVSDRQEFLNKLHRLVKDKINMDEIKEKYGVIKSSESIYDNGESVEDEAQFSSKELDETANILGSKSDEEFYEDFFEKQDDEQKKKELSEQDELKNDLSYAIEQYRIKINGIKNKLARLERMKSPVYLKKYNKTRDQINKQIQEEEQKLEDALIPQNYIENMFELFEGRNQFKIEFVLWFKQFLKNSFDKTWSDKIILYLQKKSKEIESY